MKQRMTSLDVKTDKMEKVDLLNILSYIPWYKWLPPYCRPLFNVGSNINIFADLLQGVGADPEEDPLKWIEENIPESAETENPLPVIDSDEEIETVSVLFLTNKTVANKDEH